MLGSTGCEVSGVHVPAVTLTAADEERSLRALADQPETQTTD
jgi:hypothetical protein